MPNSGCRENRAAAPPSGKGPERKSSFQDCAAFAHPDDPDEPAAGEVPAMTSRCPVLLHPVAPEVAWPAALPLARGP
jgi:hypothetical protein